MKPDFKVTIANIIARLHTSTCMDVDAEVIKELLQDELNAYCMMIDEYYMEEYHNALYRARNSAYDAGFDDGYDVGYDNGRSDGHSAV